MTGEPLVENSYKDYYKLFDFESEISSEEVHKRLQGELAKNQKKIMEIASGLYWANELANKFSSLSLFDFWEMRLFFRDLKKETQGENENRIRDGWESVKKGLEETRELTITYVIFSYSEGRAIYDNYLKGLSDTKEKKILRNFFRFFSSWEQTIEAYLKIIELESVELKIIDLQTIKSFTRPFLNLYKMFEFYYDFEKKYPWIAKRISEGFSLVVGEDAQKKKTLTSKQQKKNYPISSSNNCSDFLVFFSFCVLISIVFLWIVIPSCNILPRQWKKKKN